MANITEVSIRLVQQPKDRLVAFATVTIDDEFIIRDIAVFKGTRLDISRYFVIFPSRKDAERSSRGKDVAHPTSADARKKYEDAIVDAYLRETARHREMKQYEYGRYAIHVLSACAMTATTA